MKRLIPAAIILFFIILLCFTSHYTVNKICNETIKDINCYNNKTISAKSLENSWQKNKEKLSIFVNHGFLDEISLYISQLTLFDSTDPNHFDLIDENIQTLIYMIKEEQRLALHSFY